ncbi:BrnT family toxin (plasmid) [Skermanella rosea]|uniref:BrnT family toxin n=1 Tax=Skermanella rosea TaxID=1817965 RepID=UPI001932DB6A|nr:BrnT family toxin [Skermanella rosea]UEM07896.1 BrnT family toxin [Skermanella rosea]
MFEWDEAKSDRCLRERGYNFAFASGIFDGPILEWDDDRRNYGERRVVAVGRVRGFVLVVVYTLRGDVRRIIPSWPAKKEIRDVYQALHG